MTAYNWAERHMIADALTQAKSLVATQHDHPVGTFDSICRALRSLNTPGGTLAIEAVNEFIYPYKSVCTWMRTRWMSASWDDIQAQRHKIIDQLIARYTDS